MLMHLTKIFTEMPLHRQSLSRHLLHKVLLLLSVLAFPDNQASADELSIDSLLPAHLLVLVALRHTLAGELDVGRQGTDALVLGQLLADVDGLLLQCCREGGDDFSDGGGRVKGGVGDATADQLGKSLDELKNW